MKIKDLIDAIRSNRIRITDHADEEAQADHLTYDEIFFSVLQGEIIEDYPDVLDMPDVQRLPFQKCPICGGEMVEKEVEKLLRGGVHTATVKVKAEVCLRCGERLYSKETVMRFEQIRTKLERRDVSEFKPIGQSFQVQ